MGTEKLVLGRYRVLERVGRGAMGVIYRGLDPILDREVAIKVMSADFADEGADAKRRFFREARAAAKLQHRNIVTVFEFAEEDGVPYIVMEFLRGKNLAARIGAGPPLALEQKLTIVTELCDGLQYASENGVIHRDVKPANVWLLEDGSVKLVDFGIAKITTATSTLGKDVIGSAAYMSPEQAEGKVVDARTDIFSAAVVLYELVTGVRPFEASTPTATLLKIVQEPPPPITAPGVPAALVATIRRALEKSPADRYQTAGEFGTDLRLIRATLATGADTGPSSDSILSSTTTTRAAAASTAVTTTTGAADEARRLPVHRWGRLVLAGVIGGLVMTAVLYWAKVGRVADPPPTTTQTSGLLKIGSDPAGAAIVVDGTDTGKVTPEEISITGEGPKVIRLSKKGFKVLESPVAETDIQSGTVTYSLVAEAPVYVKVKATGSYPFELWIENRRVSEMSSNHPEVTVQLGQKVTLRASKQYLEESYQIDAAHRTIRAPDLGNVRFSAEGRDDCVLLHDGKEVRSPPFTLEGVASGARVFEFRCGENGTPTFVRANVPAGGTQKVIVQ